MKIQGERVRPYTFWIQFRCVCYTEEAMKMPVLSRIKEKGWCRRGMDRKPLPKTRQDVVGKRGIE